MVDYKQIFDDLGIAALESNIKLAAFAILSDSGKIIIQTPNWDLSNQTDILMDVLNGMQSFVLNNVDFSVVQRTEEGIVGTNAGGMGHIIMVSFQDGTLVSFAMPKADPLQALAFLKGYLTRLNL